MPTMTIPGRAPDAKTLSELAGNLVIFGTLTVVLLLTVASAGYLVAYLLVCLAAPLFLHRIGELTAPPVVATAVIVPILLVVSGAYVVTALGGPVPTVLGVLVAAVLAWYGVLRLRRPDRLRGIGVYDETSAGDVHGAAEHGVGMRG